MLSGKVAIVIGGSGGLGSAIAGALGEQGAKVAVVYLNNFQSAASTADRIPESFLQSVDITDEHQVETLMLDVRRLFGGIDILVNSAGVYTAGSTEGIKLELWERVLKVNLTGTFLACKHALPYMEKQEYGRIINVSSFTGRDALAGTSAYSASKAGIVALTKVIGAEKAEYNITANVVSPGVFDAGMVKHFDPLLQHKLRKMIPSGMFGDPSELAQMVVFLASDAASYVNRQVIGVDGGI
jgi:NAD(P)-dependent dehydrogenase (short-subunit alcohol dehydrogenase family)